MLRQVLVGIALTVVGLTSVGAQSSAAEPADRPPDLSGTWRLDRSKSDLPARPQRDAARAGMRGEPGGGPAGAPQGGRGQLGTPPGMGGMGGRGGPGRGMGGNEGAPPGERKGRGMPAQAGRLPDVMQVSQEEGALRLADSTGTIVQVIVLGQDLAQSTKSAESSPVPVAAWVGDRLEVQQPKLNDMAVTETWWLEDSGHTLKIRTRFESKGDGPSGLHTRVYERVDGS